VPDRLQAVRVVDGRRRPRGGLLYSRDRQAGLDARRALVLHEHPLLVNLIELTLNHGLFVVRAARSLAGAEAILAEWRPHLAVVDMDNDDGEDLLRRLVPPTMRRSVTPVLGLTRRGDLKTRLGLQPRGR